MAQLNRSQNNQNANNRFPDNDNKEIEAVDSRQQSIDLSDSSFNLLTDDSDVITQGAANLFVNSTEKAQIASSEQLSNKGNPNGYPGLDANGKIIASQIPSIAITEYLGVAANEAQMLLLSGEKGDWCNRSDLGTTWQIIGDDPTDINDWLQLSYPTAPVTSVNGKTGAVSLDTGDVPEDATNKYLTTASQTLDGEKTFAERATFAGNAIGSSPVITETNTFSVTDTQKNRLVFLDITSSATITVDSTTNTNFSNGDFMDLYWDSDSGSNSVTFLAGSGVTLSSKDSLLSLSAVGSSVRLIKKSSNQFRLIGDLA